MANLPLDFAFVGLAVASDTENGPILYALGNDGAVYEYTRMCHSVGTEYNGRKVHCTFYSPLFWKAVDAVFDEPTLPETTLNRMLDAEVL